MLGWALDEGRVKTPSQQAHRAGRAERGAFGAWRGPQKRQGVEKGEHEASAQNPPLVTLGDSGGVGTAWSWGCGLCCPRIRTRHHALLPLVVVPPPELVPLRALDAGFLRARQGFSDGHLPPEAWQGRPHVLAPRSVGGCPGPGLWFGDVRLFSGSSACLCQEPPTWTGSFCADERSADLREEAPGLHALLLEHSRLLGEWEWEAETKRR